MTIDPLSVAGFALSFFALGVLTMVLVVRWRDKRRPPPF